MGDGVAVGVGVTVGDGVALGDGAGVALGVALGVSAWPDGPPPSSSSSPKPPEPPGLNVTDTLRGPVIVTVHVRPEPLHAPPQLHTDPKSPVAVSVTRVPCA